MTDSTFDTRHNLPVPGDEFIGRSRYVDSVLHALLETKAWIISIDGLGGVGKSRLALEAAHRISTMRRYAGIVWVSAKSSWLTPSGIEKREPSLTSLDDLLRQIIQVAGGSEDPIETFDERKARVSRLISQKPYLLIVDNLETVRDADKRRIIAFLSELSARETGDTRALVTSREAASPGAIVVELTGLEREEGINLIRRDATNYGDTSSLLTAEEASSEIWERCAGLPLAIKWAVAMVAKRKLSLADTLFELKRRSGDVLGYVFGSVFERLSEDSKLILYTSSAFVRSIPRSALSDITRLSERRVAAAVTELLGLYLIQRLTRSVPRPFDTERYSMLPATAICVQAISLENPGICDGLMSRAVMYCSRLWTGFTPNMDIAQFEDDFENSTFLLDWSFNAQRWTDVVTLAKKLDPYMSVRGLAEERIEVCDLGMLAARYVKDGRSIVEFKEAKGKAYKQKGMYREAEEQLRECLEFYRNTGMPRELARIRMQLGILLEHQVEYSVDPVPLDDRVGRLEMAVTEYTEAYKTFQSLEDRAAQAQVLHLIGRALRHLNRFVESEKMLVSSIQLKLELGDAARIAITEHELARLRFLQGRSGEAETLYRKSIGALTEFGATKDLANAKWGFSLLLRSQKDRLDEAIRLNREAVEAYHTQGRRPKYELAQADLQQTLLLLSDTSLESIGRAPLPNDHNTGQRVAAERRSRVFISYSHADSEWLRRLRVHLRPLERMGIVDIFDDTKIEIGTPWRGQIETALESAKFAILLVSADFLASDFIHENELPPLLSAAESDGAMILPIIVSPCAFEQTEGLAQFQAANSPSNPLISVTKSEQEAVLARVANAVRGAVRRSAE